MKHERNADDAASNKESSQRSVVNRFLGRLANSRRIEITQDQSRGGLLPMPDGSSMNLELKTISRQQHRIAGFDVEALWSLKPGEAAVVHEPGRGIIDTGLGLYRVFVAQNENRGHDLDAPPADTPYLRAFNVLMDRTAKGVVVPVVQEVTLGDTLPEIRAGDGFHHLHAGQEFAVISKIHDQDISSHTAPLESDDILRYQQVIAAIRHFSGYDESI